MAGDSTSVESFNSIDRLIHEPARLMIMAYLYSVNCADFAFLLKHTQLTKGNLSSHLSKLERAGCIEIEKTYHNKTQKTILRVTAKGREAFQDYKRRMKRFIAYLPE